MTDRDLKAAIIKHVDGIDVLTHQAAQGEHFDVFVDGVFEGALERHGRAMESRAAVRETVQHSRELARGDHRGPGAAPRFDDEETAMGKMQADTAAASEHRARRRR